MTTKRWKAFRWVSIPALLAVAACTGGEDDGNDDVEVPETYTFESKFVPGESSVSYSGQIFRQLMILELNAAINGMTAKLDADTYNPAAGDVVTDLNFYYDFDVANVTTGNLLTTTTPPTLQGTYAEVSANGASLKDKIAGNDPDPQHKTWHVAGTMVGIASVGTATGLTFTPDSLVQEWFAELDGLAVAWANGAIGTDPVQNLPLEKVQVTEQGRDLRQLIQKFLWGAVTFSQAADDYLDEGLTVPNMQDETSAFSELEHHWDEGFGYFGAARDFGMRTAQEINDSAANDTNGDQAIDLLSEYSFGHSAYAAKRDVGSVVPTDFSGEAFDALITGRAIIHDAAGRELKDREWDDLLAQRDIAILAWEKSIAASVVHYLNEVIVDTTALEGGVGYDFHDHAAHWSEMKGFALSLQFSPDALSPLSDPDFATLHQKMGDAPVLDTNDTAAYKAGLLEARDLLQAAYGFDPANMGDTNGENGW